VACQEKNTSASEISTEPSRTTTHNLGLSDKKTIGRILHKPISDTDVLPNAPAPQTDQYVLGFAGFWLKLDKAHLLDIAVRPAYYRMGIGESLLISIINLALRANAGILALEVRVSNQAAQSLYHRYGFTEVGKRRGYYMNNWEDALVMVTDRITSASYQSLFQQRKRAYIERWRASRRLIV